MLSAMVVPLSPSAVSAGAQAITQPSAEAMTTAELAWASSQLI